MAQVLPSLILLKIPGKAGGLQGGGGRGGREGVCREFWGGGGLNILFGAEMHTKFFSITAISVAIPTSNFFVISNRCDCDFAIWASKPPLDQGPLNGGVSNRGVSRSGLVLPFVSFFVLFCPFLPFFWDFPDFSGKSIFPICPGTLRGFSRFVLFFFLGLLTAHTRNSPERVRDTIWTFPEKSGKPPGLETPQFSFSQE